MLGLCNNDGMLEFFMYVEVEGWLVLSVGIECIVEGWFFIYVLGFVWCVECLGDGLCCVSLQQDLYYGVGIIEYKCLQCGYGIMFECGQYVDFEVFEFVYQVILCVMVLLGLIVLDVVMLWFVGKFELLQFYEVIDCEYEGDSFECVWVSFDEVMKGQCIGICVSGEFVLVLDDGCIVFFVVNVVLGMEWFYLVWVSDW